MKKIIGIIIAVIFLVSLITGTAYASNSDAPKLDDQIIFNETYILEENTVLNGNLVAINSIVIVKENAIITGDIVLIGSSININAEVNGSLIAFGGVVNLFENTIIHGDLVTPGSETFRAEGAEVYGQLMTSELKDLKDSAKIDDIEALLDAIDVPAQPDRINPINTVFTQNSILNPIARVLWIIFSSFIVSVASVFVVLVFRKRTKVISQTIKDNPLESGGFGLVTLIVIFPILTVIFGILAITIILLPVSLLVFIIMALVGFIGWVMSCIEIGRMVVSAIKRDWSDEVIAGIGTFIMTFVIMGINLIFWDIVGWMIGMVVTALGVGALLLTRFGSKAYKPKTETAAPAESE